MSVEADFGLSGWAFQASGTQNSWTIAWSGVLDEARFAAVSFQSDFVDAQLTRVSETFATDSNENPFITETIRATEGLGGGVAFRVAVVVIPSH
ncbi:MAG TPA: hypothetical protein VGF44_12705 [Terriglobales bacterium]|jgi:hypothetical protein